MQFKNIKKAKLQSIIIVRFINLHFKKQEILKEVPFFTMIPIEINQLL